MSLALVNHKAMNKYGGVETSFAFSRIDEGKWRALWSGGFTHRDKASGIHWTRPCHNSRVRLWLLTAAARGSLPGLSTANLTGQRGTGIFLRFHRFFPSNIIQPYLLDVSSGAWAVSLLSAEVQSRHRIASSHLISLHPPGQEAGWAPEKSFAPIENRSPIMQLVFSYLAQFCSVN